MKVLIIVAFCICGLTSAFLFLASHDENSDLEKIAKRKACFVLQAQPEDLAIIGRKRCREPIVIFALAGKFSLQRFDVVKKSPTRDENIERARSLLEMNSPNFSLGEVVDVRAVIGEDYTLKYFSSGRKAYLFYYGGE